MARIEIPHHAIARFRNDLLPDGLTRADTLELRVRTSSEHITVVDFVAFLDVGDRIFGAFSPGDHSHNRRLRNPGIVDLRNYRRNEEDLLQIETINPGSVDLGFIQHIGSIVNAHSLVTMLLMWNLLRVDKATLAVKNLAEAYRAYQEAATIKEKRNAPQVDQDSLAAVAQFLQELFKNEQTTLKRAGRFAKKSVIEMLLRIKSDK